MVKQSVAQSIITQRPRFTRKSPVVAAAIVLPKFILIKILGPSSSFFLVGSLKGLSLSGISSFRFTLKIGCQEVYSCHVQFQLSHGFLAVKK